MFSPLQIRGIHFKNRVFSGPHNTALSKGGDVSDGLIAYHAARAKGGVSLFITEVQVFHPSFLPSGRLSAATDQCIPQLSRLVRAVSAYDCRVLGQLFHPGRIGSAGGGGFDDGAQPVNFAPSESPNHFYHNISVPMPSAMVWEIIDAYGQAARRMMTAGLSGVEIVASMGYLPAQFLDPRYNRRTDEFGGDIDHRLRFLREVLASIRRQAGPDALIGVRISGDEMDETASLTGEEIEAACRKLDGDEGPDYFHVTMGSGGSVLGWRHQIPHMALPAGYIAPYAERVKRAVRAPVFVTGRMNDPSIVESVLEKGQADMCGLVRALIADPEFVNKAREGQVDDIRACIACNQACIGHRLKGYPISCIQHPETGREIAYYQQGHAGRRCRVTVVGGGPAGMKAAIVAAQRGHEVRLYEKTRRLGGQVLMAQLLPGRSEFGGLITNLERELGQTACEVIRGVAVTAELIRNDDPDAVIIATGGKPYWPEIDGKGSGHVVDAWSVLNGEAKVGHRVAIADSKCDWISLGVAEKLAREGCDVTLYTNGVVAGELLPHMVRDYGIAELFKLGVPMVPYAHLYGVDEKTAYFIHTASGQPIIADNVDTVVLTFGNVSDRDLASELNGIRGNVEVIGDALNPRTAEEAILEGMRAAHKIALEDSSVSPVQARVATGNRF